jgi:hypothetical protein
MLTARAVLLAVLVVVNLAAIVGWAAVWVRRRVGGRPVWTDVVIGIVTNFLDTLGIGSYAQITAVFKLRGRPDDALIPGTLNVGSFVPSFLASLLFFGAFAVFANGVFGALMCVGIGNYAPCMVVLGVLGMHPIAAYPIMFLSDGVLIPVAGLGFLRSKRFSHGCAVGLALGGVLGVLGAFPLVQSISKHLTAMRWMVIVVILYAAVSMLRSARSAAVPAAPVAVEFPP